MSACLAIQKLYNPLCKVITNDVKRPPVPAKKSTVHQGIAKVTLNQMKEYMSQSRCGPGRKINHERPANAQGTPNKVISGAMRFVPDRPPPDGGHAQREGDRDVQNQEHEMSNSHRRRRLCFVFPGTGQFSEDSIFFILSSIST
jgi:hypothetical protein